MLRDLGHADELWAMGTILQSAQSLILADLSDVGGSIPSLPNLHRQMEAPHYGALSHCRLQVASLSPKTSSPADACIQAQGDLLRLLLFAIPFAVLRAAERASDKDQEFQQESPQR
jgi:hypothetical protein